MRKIDVGSHDSLTNLQQRGRTTTKKWLLDKLIVQAEYCSSNGGHPVGFIIMLFQHVLKIADNLNKVYHVFFARFYCKKFFCFICLLAKVLHCLSCFLEYSMKAINRANVTSIGVQGKNCVAFVTQKNVQVSDIYVLSCYLYIICLLHHYAVGYHSYI